MKILSILDTRVNGDEVQSCDGGCEPPRGGVIATGATLGRLGRKFECLTGGSGRGNSMIRKEYYRRALPHCKIVSEQ